MNYDPKKVINIALAEVGYLEKGSNADLDNKTSNVGDKNYTKYARDLDAAGFYNGRKQSVAWCDVFVDWAFVQAYGKDAALTLTFQPTEAAKNCGAGCKYSRRYYQENGRLFKTPQSGDQIFFYNKKKTQISHTGLVYDVDSNYVYTVEGNTSSASGVVANGGAVAKKKYKLNYVRLAGFGRPNWGAEHEIPVSPPDSVTPEQKIEPVVYKLGERLLKLKSSYMTGDDVKEMQTHLNHLGYNCGTADGVFGKKTRDGVKAFQRDNGLTVDGEFGSKSFAKLTDLIQPVQNPPEPVEPENPGTVYPVHGFIPDVSAYQGNIDIDKFVAGNDFAILRARVNGKDDSKFKTWAAELQKRNFPFAVYDYLRLKSEDDAIKQADAMFKACHPFAPRIYYLDTEQLADGMTYDKERELIKIYVQRLRDWGVELVGQYTGDYRWRTQYKSLNGIFDTLWIANWGSNNGSYEGITLKSAAYTDKIHLHQFTSYGYTKVPGAPGISHRVDLNRLTGVVPLSYFTGRNHGEPVAEHRTYTVQPNDTLWGIAKRFYGNGNKYKDIMTANQMTSTVIHAGTVLVIPA